MAERTILASFRSAADAQAVADQLQAMGAGTTQVDELHAQPGLRPDRRAFPITGDIPSLASLTLNVDVRSRDAGVLLAADPSASGLSDGQGNVTGRNFLLTAICPESIVERAVQAIKDGDGFT